MTGVDGELLHIEWSTGGGSSLVPGAGSITIVGKVSDKTAAKRTIKKLTAKKRTPVRKAANRAARKSAPAKKRTPARKAANQAAKKSAPAKKR
ncbi:MAG TPA: hypothetical protein VLX59_10720, partial [Acidimicrobiales bacterium]|nr:hypothetical protein [Acidimicrobiales bacterium]